MKEVIVENITNRVKTFEDACDVLGIDEKERHLPYIQKPESKLQIVIQALNQGWLPTWDDCISYQAYPRYEFNLEDEKLHVIFAPAKKPYYFSSAHPFFSAGLVLKTPQLAQYAASQFKDLYNEIILIIPFSKTPGVQYHLL